MKLVIAIINNDDSQKVLSEISRAGLYATKLSTTGTFLRAGNVTLLIGVEDERLDETLDIFRNTCSKREEVTSVMPGYAPELMQSVPVKITVGGATIFVLDVEQFHKM